MSSDPTSIQCENRGRSVVQDFVSAEANHGWQELDAQNDDGVDGIIFIKKNGQKTGEIVFAQVKCGVKDRGYWKESTSRPGYIGVHLTESYIQKHTERWRNVPGPMILIFVEYDSKKAYWTDLRDESSFSPENKQIVLVKKSQRFGIHSFGEFKKLRGYTHISQSYEWVNIEDSDVSYIKFEQPIKFKDQAKKYYKDWSNSVKSERTSPLFGEVIVSRVGWRHITRRKRKKTRIFQSLQLLGIAKQIIKQSNKFWQVKVLNIKTLPDGTIIHTDFIGLRSRVKFTFRGATIVQVLLKRKKIVNPEKGIFSSEVRFYSVYEPLVKRDI